MVDSENTGRCLVYAFGEIALVVVGILIALQINNWNQNKSQKRTLESHLNTVLENLKNDKIQLESLINFRETSFQSSRAIIAKRLQNEIDKKEEDYTYCQSADKNVVG